MQERAMTETPTTCGVHPIDLEVATRAERALRQHPSIPPTVCVHVWGGVAWLTGSAACRAERIEAEQVVRRVCGVSRVVNQVVAPRSSFGDEVEHDRPRTRRAVW
jgi:osmotically-inducible protein OsmY